MTRPKLLTAPTICPDCQLRGETQAPCKHQLTGGPIGAVPRIKGCAGVLPLEGALGYTPGASGALTGPESALSSLPSCPCYVAPHRVGPLGDRCGMPTRHLQRYGARSLVCSAGHVFEPDLRAKQGREWSPREHEQALGALAADERRAPHTPAERAGKMGGLK